MKLKFYNILSRVNSDTSFKLLEVTGLFKVSKDSKDEIKFCFKPEIYQGFYAAMAIIRRLVHVEGKFFKDVKKW